MTFADGEGKEGSKMGKADIINEGPLKSINKYETDDNVMTNFCFQTCKKLLLSGNQIMD